MERELRENTSITRELRDILVTVKTGAGCWAGWGGHRGYPAVAAGAALGPQATTRQNRGMSSGNRIPVHVRRRGRLQQRPARPRPWKPNSGISKRSYPAVDIKALTLDQAKAIYQRDYWQPPAASACRRKSPLPCLTRPCITARNRHQVAAARAEGSRRRRIRPHHPRHDAESRHQRNA